MWVANIITVFIIVPLLVGGVAGLRVRAGDGYRQTPAIAWFCTLAIDVLMLIVGFATTPQSDCGGTGDGVPVTSPGAMRVLGCLCL
jgi:hypothetical protein